MRVHVGPVAGSLLIYALFAAVPTLASPSLAFGPTVEVARPQGGYVGAMRLEPNHGEIGAPFTVHAEGLPPNAEFQLIWRTVDGSWKVTDWEYNGREFTPVDYEMGRATSDADGRLQATFVTPEDFGFFHDIVLQKDGRLYTQAAYSIDMTVDISPKQGPVGTPINVEIRGIGYRDLERSWNLLYDNRFTGWASSITTHGSASFTIPAVGHVGDHFIEVIHGQFGATYRNQEQSPSPDRPRFLEKFTITAGDPVLPPPAREQWQKHVRLAPPSGELVPEPRFSAVGDPVAVATEGLTPGQEYTLTWSRVVGNRIDGNGWTADSMPIAKAVADKAGRVAFQFETPDDLGGYHDLSIEADGKTLSGKHFIQTTAYELDRTSGPAGTTFAVHLKGVGWTETANIMHLVYDNAYIGYACGFNSQGDVVIYMQATGAPGMHYIDLYPGIYKGENEIPINFRMPQLTYEADHPNEDLPAFRFAFEVTPN